MLERIAGPPAASEARCLAELVFCLAGLPERKRYGWELFQRGGAPTLLLSVGRNEARFLKARAGLPDDGNIVSLLPIRPERGNHIFLWADQGGLHPEVIRLPELNTFGEIWALAEVIHSRRIRRVLVVSSGAHLRRIRYAVRKLLGVSPVQITYLGVPEGMRTLDSPRWWPRAQDARMVIAEWMKLAGYHVKYGILRWHHRYAASLSGAPR